MDLKEIGQRAKDASYILGTMDSKRKNEGLRAAASELSGRREEILRANEEDLRLAREKGMAQGLLDRLLLTPEPVSYTHLDLDGNEITLNKGKTWICIIGADRYDKAEIYGK